MEYLLRWTAKDIETASDPPVCDEDYATAGNGSGILYVVVSGWGYFIYLRDDVDLRDGNNPIDRQPLRPYKQGRDLALQFPIIRLW